MVVKQDKKLVVNLTLTNSPIFQLLFTTPVLLDAAILREKINQFDASLIDIHIEVEPESENWSERSLCLIGWDDHIIRLTGFDSPVSDVILDACIKTASYEDEIKLRANQHSSNLQLSYVGYTEQVYEQYVALATIAAIFAELGAIVVVNEIARISLPVSELWQLGCEQNGVQEIKKLPLLVLFCGFARYQIEGFDGILVRTYGADYLEMQDFAALVADHSDANIWFDLFSNLLSYQLYSKSRFSDGDKAEVSGNIQLSLQLFTEDYPYLASKGELFLAKID